MLYAIFFLLLIVFFPILSLILGVGFIAIIVKFWWVILLFIVISGIVKYLDGNATNRVNQSKDDLPPKKPIFTFSGESNLGNDSYVLFLTKNYDIQINGVLNKYVVGERLFNTLEEALEAGDRLYQDGLIRKAEETKINRQVLAGRKVKAQRVLMIFGVLVLGWLIFSSVLENKQREASSAQGNECEVVALRDVTEVDTDGVTQQCFMTKNMKGEPFESCPKVMKKGDKMSLVSQSIFTALDGKQLYCEHGGLCFPKKAFITTEKCSSSQVADNQRKESDYSKFSTENQELIQKWFRGIRENSDSYWDADIRRKLNQAGICYGMDGQSRAEYDWHKCTPKSFKDY